MHEAPLLPRRGLSIGATGTGEGQRHYKLVAQIDRGGMGELFLAELTESDGASRYVVIKRLLADLLDDEKYVAMFVAEATVMSKLRHPNIVHVFDTPKIDETPCLAMEYVRGKNGQQILTRCRDLDIKIPPAIVLRIMSQVLRGLEYAHNARMEDGTPLNLVHRDVTPGNVLVSYAGDVKLTDFGIAKSQMSAVSTTVGIVKGKARYLAPEQILGEAATPRSDIFSCSCVVVEMLTGEPLFERGSVPKTLYAIVNGERPPLDQTLGFRAPLLVQILNRALMTDPKQRPQTARELAEGLDAAGRLIDQEAGGRTLDRQGVGSYVRDLFRDVEDPLARFDPVELPVGEQVTIAGYQSEVLEPEARIASIPPPSRSAAVIRETIEETITGDGKPPPSPPPSLPLFNINNLKEARRETTQVIKGRSPSTPLDVAPAPRPPGTTVDEALSVLAWLQSRHESKTRSGDAPLVEAAEEVVRRSEPSVEALLEKRRPAKKPFDDEATLFAFQKQRHPLLLLFGLGAIAGIFGTLAVQALIRSAEPKPKPMEVASAAASAPPSDDLLGASDESEELDPSEQDSSVATEIHIGHAGEAATSADGTIDLLEPKGARVRIDGNFIKDKIPIRNLSLRAGKHELRILGKGHAKRDLSFALEPGEKLDLTKRLRKHPGALK